MPASPAVAQDPGSAAGAAVGNANNDLFGSSPMCDAGGTCSESGVSWRVYPTEHYGIDNYIALGVDNLGNYLHSAVQTISAVVWQGVLLIVNGILLLLEWAFSLALTEEAMPDLIRALDDLHENVLGTPWTLAAITVAGMWGIYNGLVRMRTIQTLGGLAATVLMMAAALYIIDKPEETVGEFSRFVNDSALGVIGLGDGGADGEDAWRGASERLFSVAIVGPWCALQFGSVDFCDEPDPDHPEMTVKEAWLETPAWSDEREEVHHRYFPIPQSTDDDPTNDPVPAERGEYFDKRGAFARIGLLALVLAGLIGQAALYLWCGMQLVVAGVSALLLTLATPVMLLVPAFGEAGRKAFGTWAKRLAGAVFAKLIFALFLSLVLLVGNVIATLDVDSLTWGGKWVILTVFWWGVLMKRQQILGFVTGGQGSGGGMSGMGPLKAWLGYRMVRDVGGDLARGATYAPRQAARGASWAARTTRRHLGPASMGAHRHARDETARESIKSGLRRRAGRHFEQQRENAKQVLANEQEWRNYESNRNRKGKPKGQQPKVARPTAAQAQNARTVINRHGVEGEIAVTDADIERFVRESGSPVIEERWQQSQRPGMTRAEIKAEERKRPTQFKRRVTHRRRSYRREQRAERARSKVYHR